jgi:type I restriction enzyme S subunit
MSPTFLEYFLRTQKVAMDRLAPKGTQKNINIQFLQPWPVPLPPFEEQEEIAQSLSSLDSKVTAEKGCGRSLEVLFKTLLHNLMTGKMRVNDLDLPKIEEVV